MEPGEDGENLPLCKSGIPCGGSLFEPPHFLPLVPLRRAGFHRLSRERQAAAGHIAQSHHGVLQ